MVVTPWVIAQLSENATSTAIASVIAAAVAGFAAWATQRTAAAAAVRNQSVASRTDIELAAFERAKTYYTDTIDRQDAEIHGLEDDVSGLKTEVAGLQQGRREDRAEIERLADELAVAKAALHMRYPDEF